MEIYLRTEKSIIKMNDVLEINGKYLVMATLDRTKQCVLAQYQSEDRTRQVLDSIDSILTRKCKDEEKILIIEIPKE